MPFGQRLFGVLQIAPELAGQVYEAIVAFNGVAASGDRCRNPAIS